MRSASRTISQPSFRSMLFLIGALALIMRLVFWITIQWTIEDGMIVGRIVRNFATHGILSFNVDERVSTSTSPIFTLAAALLASIANLDPIVAIKSIGLVSAVITCLLIFRILTQFLPRSLAAIATGIYVFLPPVIAYSTNGLETALYTLLCCAALERIYVQDDSKAVILGAFAALVRPDGVLVLGIVGLAVLWGNRSDWRALIRKCLPAVMILAVGLGAHYLYYGALFPQTVTAKLAGYHVDPVENALKYLERMLVAQPTGIPLYILAVWAVIRIIKKWPQLLFFLSWYVIYHLFFMLRAPLFDWYLHPPLFVLCLFAGLGLFDLIDVGLRWIKRDQFVLHAQTLVGSLLLVLLLLSSVPYARNRLNGQKHVDATNKAASLWLRQNVGAGDVVFTEALGYIGYFNDARFVDWPGLTSSDIPDLLSKNDADGRYRGYILIIQTYQPNYLVLRSNEWRDLRAELEPQYRECAQFPADDSRPDWYVICQNEAFSTG